MARILVTGSTEGVGRATAQALLNQGNDVVVHARTKDRLAAAGPLLERGAQAVIGDLADLAQVADLAAQANALGACDVVIHNAGTIDEAWVLPVNVVAPYVLTATIARPARLIYLSSSMHRGGRQDLTGIDWTSQRRTRSYSDSKLLLTALMAATARLWPDVMSHAVDPGWVPTRMGGPQASDDLAQAHTTQVWLATTDDPAAQASGGYWFHMHAQQPHPAVHDEAFQDQLLESLAAHTGVTLAP